MNARLLSETGILEEALVNAGRSAEIPRSADIYGWLVGSWDLDVLHYWAIDVSSRGIKAEVHAAWVLEGRAIQDLWIMPPRSERNAPLDKKMNMYGTTLRLWDATLPACRAEAPGEGGAWRITWRNPAGDHHEDQIGRREGRDIVQLGVRPDGTQTRWSFKEITSQSFHWLGESLAPGGKTWTLEGEFRARRLG